VSDSGLELPRRPLGPAIVTGAVRGAIAGILPTAIACLLSLVRRPTGSEIGIQLVTVLVFGVWFAAAQGVAEAVASRLPAVYDAAGRFACAFAAVMTGVIPLCAYQALRAGTFAFDTEFTFDKLHMGPLIWTGVSLGTAMGVVGTHVPGSRTSARVLRAVKVGLVFGLVAAFGLPELGFGPFLLGLLLCAGLAALLAVGHLWSQNVGQTLGNLLDPQGGTERVERAARLRTAFAAWKAARENASKAPNEATRRFHLEAALGYARAAYDDLLGSCEELAPAWARRIVGHLFELERLDEIDTPLALLPEREPLLAERRRRRGDLAGARETARVAIESVATRADLVASAIRVNGHTVIALVELASGDTDLASKHLRYARAEQSWAEPFTGLPRFEAIDAEIRARVEQAFVAPPVARPGNRTA
jgi:hypothetical protein